MGEYPAQLVLVRHGETDWNRDHIPQGHIDVPLNKSGRQQAHALAKRLQGRKIDAIHSSDLFRAAETAAIVGAAVELTPQPSAAWREIDLGGWGGLTREKIQAHFGDELAALARGEDVPRGGGETMAALQARVVKGFERLRRSHPGQTVLMVSHGGTIKTLICHLIGLELRYVGRLPSLGNTSLSLIEFGSGRPRLAVLNDTEHLDRGLFDHYLLPRLTPPGRDGHGKGTSRA